MPTVAIKISNLAEIKRAFGRSPVLMAKQLDIAIERSIYEISRDSKLGTPVDTGRLRASTYEKFSRLRGETGTNTDYDIFVHEGTKFMRARPYLRNSVNKNSANVQRYFTQAVQKVLDVIGRETE